MSEQKKLTVFGDRILVEPVTETKSLLHITESHKWRYKVVAVGKGRITEFGHVIRPLVEEGDVVIINPNDVQSIDTTDVSFKIAPWHAVLAKE